MVLSLNRGSSSNIHSFLTQRSCPEGPAEQARFGHPAAPDLERAKAPNTKGLDSPYFSNPGQPTCSPSPPRAETPQCQPGLQLTLPGGKGRQAALARSQCQVSAHAAPGRPPSPRALPPDALLAEFWGPWREGSRGRVRAGGRAPRAGRWARPLASVRAPRRAAPRLLPHVPGTPHPFPARSARLPPSRQVPLGLPEAHTPRGASATAAASAAAL